MRSSTTSIPTPHTQTPPVAQAYRVVVARAVLQALDPVEPHDGAAVDAEELAGVKSVLERLHLLPDDEGSL